MADLHQTQIRYFGLYEGGYPRLQAEQYPLRDPAKTEYYKCQVRRDHSQAEREAFQDMNPQSRAMMLKLHIPQGVLLETHFNPGFKPSDGLKLAHQLANSSAPEQVQEWIDKAEPTIWQLLPDCLEMAERELLVAGQWVEIDRINRVQKQIAELLQAYWEHWGERLRALVLFGPLAEGTGYEEIDVLAVMQNWDGPKQGLEAIEAMAFPGWEDWVLPGHLCLVVLSPEQLLQATGHPMLQEIAKSSCYLFDPDGLIAQAMGKERRGE